jgi:DNA-binding response OmpR family regulator
MMLQNQGFEAVSAANLRETRNALKSGDFDLVILGVSMDGDASAKWPAHRASFAIRRRFWNCAG